MKRNIPVPVPVPDSLFSARPTKVRSRWCSQDKIKKRICFVVDGLGDIFREMNEKNRRLVDYSSHRRYIHDIWSVKSLSRADCGLHLKPSLKFSACIKNHKVRKFHSSSTRFCLSESNTYLTISPCSIIFPFRICFY